MIEIHSSRGPYNWISLAGIEGRYLIDEPCLKTVVLFGQCGFRALRLSFGIIMDFYLSAL